jgi:hypothetical protein
LHTLQEEAKLFAEVVADIGRSWEVTAGRLQAVIEIRKSLIGSLAS